MPKAIRRCLYQKFAENAVRTIRYHYITQPSVFRSSETLCNEYHILRGLPIAKATSYCLISMRIYPPGEIILWLNFFHPIIILQHLSDYIKVRAEKFWCGHNRPSALRKKSLMPPCKKNPLTAPKNKFFTSP